MSLFSVEERERLRARVLEWAATDERVVAGAVVGSLALGDGDRWSDLDLTFAVADGTPVTAVLADWSDALAREFDAVQLFDVPSGAFLYRVFLVPGCLQFDLSFAPASAFGAAAPTFRLLFGTAVETAHAEPPPAHELFGQAVHHALRAASASSAAGSGRRSTGSAPSATTRSPSPAGAAACRRGTDEASTISRPR